MSIRLSPSSLSDFKKSPVLFWLEKHHDLKMPRGAFPSLPGGIDRVLKGYFDAHRAAGTIPAELVGKVPFGLYKDQAQLKRWRFWKTGLAVDLGPGRSVSGALDDLLAHATENLHSVLDYKTRGAAPKEGGTEQYYGIQADTYDMMLAANGLVTNGQAFFAYYWPNGMTQSSGGPIIHFGFDTDVVVVRTDLARAREFAVKAFECLEGPMPEVREGDEVTDWLVQVLDRLGYKRAAGAAAELQKA